MPLLPSWLMPFLLVPLTPLSRQECLPSFTDP
jgi:hypothetical protein